MALELRSDPCAVACLLADTHCSGFEELYLTSKSSNLGLKKSSILDKVPEILENLTMTALTCNLFLVGRIKSALFWSGHLTNIY